MTSSEELLRARRFYAEELQAVCNLQSSALVAAFARVPREQFLGPGPWQLFSAEAAPGRSGYHQTPDADPRHVYHNVAVALDASRTLNNGQPATLAAWIDALAPRPGEWVVHIGSGSGYFTAILAEMVGPNGRVTAYEVDPELAAAAQANLRPWPYVSVLPQSGCGKVPVADAILVNAGVTHPAPSWLDALADGGRLLFPLTMDMPGPPVGKGVMMLVTRRGQRFEACAATMVAIYNCVGGREPALAPHLRTALASGAWSRVRSLRRDAHEKEPDCWLHGEGWCLSCSQVR